MYNIQCIAIQKELRGASAFPNREKRRKAARARGIAPDTAVAIAADFTKDSILQTALDKTEARYGLNSESRMFAYLTALERAAKKS